MERKKLVVNSAICDARNVSESTLKSYESISINAACVFVSNETKELFSRYNVSMNTSDVMEIPAEAEVMIQNGTYEISEGTAMAKPVVLVVNGSLEIKKGSQEALKNFLSILVNGQVFYPSDLQHHLPLIKVNGSTDCYPANAIRLKNKLNLDNIFILKAKNSKYYVRNKIIIADETLNISLLTDKGASFITKRAIVPEKLLEKSLPLFNEEADIQVIPSGYSYVPGNLLDENLIRRHGNKLYVDGDLVVSTESENALQQLMGAKIKGNVLIVEKLVDKFQSLDTEYNKMQKIKGRILQDKGLIKIDKQMISKEDGITFSDCGVVQLQADITPEEIEEKLQFIDCGCIFCYPNQKSSVEIVSDDVGYINDSGINEIKDLGGVFEGSNLYDKDTQVINAASYTM